VSVAGPCQRLQYRTLLSYGGRLQCWCLCAPAAQGRQGVEFTVKVRTVAEGGQDGGDTACHRNTILQKRWGCEMLEASAT
jgi:hypothetical protein